ncbi:MAG: CHASE2 domain-containing protein [Deltaproteobacteria bacterium]|nr:CHASE2 domain-containing protein [Deltaproteobacteria bacterium]
MKNVIKRYDVLFSILIFLLLIPAEYFEWFSTLENQTLSVRHILRMNYGDEEKIRFTNDKIGVVFLDEEFFQEYGSFPLRRTDIGKIVENLRFLGAKVVVVDMLMDFPSSYKEDPIIAASLKKAGNNILVSMLEFRKGKFSKIIYPTEKIKGASTTAYSNHSKDGNMLNRLRIYPQVGKELNEWPASVSAVAMYLGVKPKVEDDRLILGDIVVQLDHYNDFRNDFPALKPNVPFLSKDPYVGISGMDILTLDLEEEDDVDEFRSLVEDKIIFFGDTSEVSHDIFDTIVGEVYGVDIMAIEAATLLKGAHLTSAHFIAELIQFIVILVLLIAIGFISEPKYRFLATIGLLLVFSGWSILAYVSLDLVFSAGYALIGIILSFIAVNVYLFILERQQKSFITGAFGQYLSPDVIEILMDDPSKLSLGGERREMTAYFSDVAGFSTISESLTPDELVQLLNHYLTEMCNIISHHNGTIDKFEGDAIIAFWGAPIIQPDHAKLCCWATVDMQKKMVEMRRELKEQGKPELQVRMGLNSGPMVVGNMGSQSRMDYTIMGDAVNLAARLEGANKFYKNHTMISQFTYEMAKDHIDVRELDTIRVVGKDEPITVYDLIERKNQTTGKKADLIEIYNQALGMYKQRDFKKAMETFQKALAIIATDGPSQTYVERCAEFVKEPPPADWDGVYRLTSKG